MMTFQELQSLKIPFHLYDKKNKYAGMAIGYTENDPLGVGGGLMPDMPCIHFKGGGWLLVADLLKNYELLNGKLVESIR